MVVAHNGIVPGFGSEERSDTRHFIDTVLERMPLGFSENPSSIRAIEACIGNSKLVFLDRDGRAVIVNEEQGVWWKGVWYSNTTIFTPAP
jgi:hypothetical protein